MGSHWPGVPQEVVATFLLPTLKKMQKPMGLYVEPPPAPPLLLFFTVPPNDTYACV